MISDIFGRQRRATALSIYSVGIYIGILGGFLLAVGSGILRLAAGLLRGRAPASRWQSWFGLRFESAARLVRRLDTTCRLGAPLAEVARLLWSRRSFRHIALAASLQAFIIYAIGNWLPSFFLRTYDIGIGQLGTWMALTTGFGGASAPFSAVGWRIAWVRRTPMVPVAPASLTIITAPVLIVLLTTDSLYFALFLVAPFNFLTAAYLGAVLAVSHNLVVADAGFDVGDCILRDQPGRYGLARPA